MTNDIVSDVSLSSDTTEEEYQPVYFPLYLSNNDTIQSLSDDEVGRIIKALMTLATTGEVADLSDNRTCKALFQIFASQMYRDFKKMRQKSKNGKNGGAPEGNQNAAKSKNLVVAAKNNPDIDITRRL